MFTQITHKADWSH